MNSGDEVKYNGVCPLVKEGRRGTKTRWWARAIVHGVKIDLGYFDSPHEAAYELCKARIEEEKKMMAAAAAAFVDEQKEKGRADADQRRKWDSNTPGLTSRALRNPGAGAAI